MGPMYLREVQLENFKSFGKNDKGRAPNRFNI